MNKEGITLDASHFEVVQVTVIEGRHRSAAKCALAIPYHHAEVQEKIMGIKVETEAGAVTKDWTAWAVQRETEEQMAVLHEGMKRHNQRVRGRTYVEINGIPPTADLFAITPDESLTNPPGVTNTHSIAHLMQTIQVTKEDGTNLDSPITKVSRTKHAAVWRIDAPLKDADLLIQFTRTLVQQFLPTWLRDHWPNCTLGLNPTPAKNSILREKEREIAAQNEPSGPSPVLGDVESGNDQSLTKSEGDIWDERCSALLGPPSAEERGPEPCWVKTMAGFPVEKGNEPMMPAEWIMDPYIKQDSESAIGARNRMEFHLELLVESPEGITMEGKEEEYLCDITLAVRDFLIEGGHSVTLEEPGTYVTTCDLGGSLPDKMSVPEGYKEFVGICNHPTKAGGSSFRWNILTTNHHFGSLDSTADPESTGRLDHVLIGLLARKGVTMRQVTYMADNVERTPFAQKKEPIVVTPRRPGVVEKGVQGAAPTPSNEGLYSVSNTHQGLIPPGEMAALQETEVEDMDTMSVAELHNLIASQSREMKTLHHRLNEVTMGKVLSGRTQMPTSTGTCSTAVSASTSGSTLTNSMAGDLLNRAEGEKAEILRCGMEERAAIMTSHANQIESMMMANEAMIATLREEGRKMVADARLERDQQQEERMQQWTMSDTRITAAQVQVGVAQEQVSKITEILRFNSEQSMYVCERSNLNMQHLSAKSDMQTLRVDRLTAEWRQLAGEKGAVRTSEQLEEDIIKIQAKFDEEYATLSERVVDYKRDLDNNDVVREIRVEIQAEIEEEEKQAESEEGKQPDAEPTNKTEAHSDAVSKQNEGGQGKDQPSPPPADVEKLDIDGPVEDVPDKCVNMTQGVTQPMHEKGDNMVNTRHPSSEGSTGTKAKRLSIQTPSNNNRAIDPLSPRFSQFSPGSKSHQRKSPPEDMKPLDGNEEGDEPKEKESEPTNESRLMVPPKPLRNQDNEVTIYQNEHALEEEWALAGTSAQTITQDPTLNAADEDDVESVTPRCEQCHTGGDLWKCAGCNREFHADCLRSRCPLQCESCAGPSDCSTSSSSSSDQDSDVEEEEIDEREQAKTALNDKTDDEYVPPGISATTKTSFTIGSGARVGGAKGRGVRIVKATPQHQYATRNRRKSDGKR